MADWAVIEVEYRAGVKPLRTLAAEHGLTHGAVRKRALRDGWTRDLTAKIRAKADSLVSKSVVSTEVSTQRAVTEAAVVDANATLQASIRREHRADIRKSHALVMSLLAEVEAQTGNPELFAELGKLLASPDDKGVDKLGDLYAKVISTPGRVTSLKALVESQKTLVALEREAFGIDDRRKVRGEAVVIGSSDDALADRGKAILDAMMAGKVSPDQAHALMAAVAAHAQIVYVNDLQQRLEEVEAKARAKEKENARV